MSDWDHRPDRPGERQWREREMRERNRRPGDGRDFGQAPLGRDDRMADYNQAVGPYAAGGGGSQGYGQGGDTSYGQMARGSSDEAGGGYGGANVGGWGQSGLTSQWGSGGYGPLNTGLQYGQDGGRFGPRGYDEGSFGPAHHDEHHASYRNWRDNQLANHDRDYGRWRTEQSRRYDEDYNRWRNERHSAFSKEFEGWRADRDVPDRPNADTVHGANPTLSKIAEGHEGPTHREHDPKHDNKADPGK